jgi:hypothetical protein
MKINNMHIKHLLLVFLIIYISDDSYLFGSTGPDYIFSNIKYVFYIMLILGNIKWNFKYDVVWLSLLLSLIALTSIVNIDIRGGYIYQAMVITLAYLLVKKISITKFVQLFNKHIYVLGSLSLITFLIAILVPGLLKSFPLVINTAGVESRFLFVSTILGSFGRNTGIFREPGVYMIFLNIAIIFSLYNHDIKKRRFVLIYVLCIITTKSTSGILITGILLTAMLLSKTTSLSNKNRFTIFIVTAAFVSFYGYSIEHRNEAFSKTNRNSERYVSTLSRVVSLVVPLKNTIQHPFFGSGISKFIFEFEKESIKTFNIPLKAKGTATNTFANSYATYGLLFGSILIYGVYKLSWQLFRDSLVLRFSVFISLLGMFSNGDLRYSVFFYMIVFYGLVGRKTESNEVLENMKYPKILSLTAPNAN